MHGPFEDIYAHRIDYPIRPLYDYTYTGKVRTKAKDSDDEEEDDEEVIS